MSFDINFRGNFENKTEVQVPDKKDKPTQLNVANSQANLQDEFVKVKNNNGLIEKFYNFLKNSTGIGLGSKKIEKDISESKENSDAEKNVKKEIQDYKISQENASQNFGDFLSTSAAGIIYFGVSNLLKKIGARDAINALPGGLSKLRKLVEEDIQTDTAKDSVKVKPKDEKLGSKGLKFEKIAKNMRKSLKNFLDATHSNKKIAAIAVPVAMFAGGITKYWALKFNRIGSKEYELENSDNLDKKTRKQEQKQVDSKRSSANLKNFGTGLLNGLLAPVMGIAGGIIGLPAYILANTGIRYANNKNEDKPKSGDGFINNIKNNVLLDSVFALALAVPGIKKAGFSKVLEKNLNEVVSNLKDVKLKNSEKAEGDTGFNEIKDLLLNSDKIKKIRENGNIDVNEKINQITNENIFAVKFLQILSDGSELTKTLVENCPPTRTIGEAQQEVNKLLNHDDYKVSKLLGVGTIAESYLAKGKDGKEVCIKILKDGINAEKLQKDKEKFLNLVTNGTPSDKLTKIQEYLVKNIENLSDGVSKELDFENELVAAKKLAQHTKVANVVVPIEAKPGIYVMEKAPGISLDTMVKYYKLEGLLTSATKSSKDVNQEYVEKINKKIAEVKAKSPDFEAFSLSSQEINKLLKQYINVLVEQFDKVERNGKTVHADIHPGNIFVDVNAFKTGKGKTFTLIDTGNTIDLSKEQMIANLKLTSYLKNGNVKDLTKIITDNVILPEGMTSEKLYEKVEADLGKMFFDNETKLDAIGIDEFFKLSDNILRKYNAIRNDTQFNLNKAKVSASKSLNGLAESFFEKKYSGIDSKTMDTQDAVLLGTKLMKDVGVMATNWKMSSAVQETKNQTQMSLKEIWNNFRNKNMLKTNSKEYLTYKFKQNMVGMESEGNPFGL